MTIFTTDDRITALSGDIRLKFLEQFPDLESNHIAWMCWREGWQRGAESAYAEAYHLDEWVWK